jgi:hypothetical protein
MLVMEDVRENDYIERVGRVGDYYSVVPFNRNELIPSLHPFQTKKLDACRSNAFTTSLCGAPSTPIPLHPSYSVMTPSKSTAIVRREPFSLLAI